MSRSGYTDDMDDNWALIRWRGAVASAIKGKRGQALLKEMEAALLVLPEKVLISNEFANAADGTVCALGAIALKRRLDKGQDRAEALKEIEKEFPEGCEAEEIAEEMGIADALCKEITYVNDEDFTYGDTSPSKRYEDVLKWIREQIKKEPY